MKKRSKMETNHTYYLVLFSFFINKKKVRWIIFLLRVSVTKQTILLKSTFVIFLGKLF